MSKRLRKILLLTLAAVVLPGIRLVHQELNAERERFNLTHTAPLENAPPALAFTTVALGGFRGLIANFLWFRAVKLQDEGKFFEMVSLSDWITKLQPDSGMVWANQAWNMAYNISVQFTDFHDRWIWVRSGIELLRDQGLRYNPNDVNLYRELAWIYQDKIGTYTDYGNNFLKAAWATEMMNALGPTLNVAAVANPKTDEDRKRAALLRERFNLDPAWMKHVDEHYGPFDWRTPEAHAIYWADLGLEKCTTKPDRLKLYRAIWQCLVRSVQKGRLIINTADQRLEFGPNLDLIPMANEAYVEIKQAEPEKSDYISRGHKTFLKDSIYFLYTHNRLGDAAWWFNYTRKQFPDAIPEGLSLDEFVVARVTEQVDQGKLWRVNAIIEGLIGQHFYNLAIGEEDQANGYALLARRVWERYQARFAREKQQQQLGLPSLAEFQQRVREQIKTGEHGFSPALREQLRARGWSDETNAPMETKPIAQPVSPTAAKSDSR